MGLRECPRHDCAKTLAGVPKQNVSEEDAIVFIPNFFGEVSQPPVDFISYLLHIHNQEGWVCKSAAKYNLYRNAVSWENATKQPC